MTLNMYTHIDRAPTQHPLHPFQGDSLPLKRGNTLMVTHVVVTAP